MHAHRRVKLVHVLFRRVQDADAFVRPAITRSLVDLADDFACVALLKALYAPLCFRAFVGHGEALRWIEEQTPPRTEVVTLPYDNVWM